MNAFRMVPVKENKNRNDGLGAKTGEKYKNTKKANSYLMKIGGTFMAYKHIHTVNKGKREINAANEWQASV